MTPDTGRIIARFKHGPIFFNRNIDCGASDINTLSCIFLTQIANIAFTNYYGNRQTDTTLTPYYTKNETTTSLSQINTDITSFKTCDLQTSKLDMDGNK